MKKTKKRMSKFNINDTENLKEYNQIAAEQAMKYDTFDFNVPEQTRNVQFKIPLFKKILRHKFQSQKKLNILDIGCGNSPFFEMFKDHNYTGTDISKKIVEENNKKGIRTLLVDITRELPKVEGGYDVVIASEMIEHVLDTDDFLKKIYDVLAVDGILILTTPNIASIRGRMQVLSGRRPTNIDHRVHPSLPGHIRAFSVFDIRDLMVDAGFSHVKIIGLDISKFLGPILNVLTRFEFFKSLCGTIVACGIKKNP